MPINTKKYYLHHGNQAVKLLIVWMLLCFGCKKFVEVDNPKSLISATTVFTSDATATASVLNIYATLESSAMSYNMSLYPGLAADELTSYSTNQALNEMYRNSILPTNSVVSTIWNNFYKSIYSANAVLEGLNSSSGVSPTVKQQLAGETKFMRAFAYFYLVNLFGDVPLATSTNYQLNSVAGRTSRAAVFQQIVADLKDAQMLLTDNYVDANNNPFNERVRANKWAATALLARTYLYLGDWSNAEIQSTAIINFSSKYSLVANLNNVFLKNSSESILQLMPTAATRDTREGNQFILSGTPSQSALSSFLINSFELSDNRKSAWTKTITVGSNTYFYVYKYKVKSIAAGTAHTEYSTLLRLSEQYLIRAEARAQLNNIAGAAADLNIIRNRAGLSNTTANDKPSMLSSILHERQVELFVEWGHRWLDLKRTGTIDATLSVIKGSNWQTTDALFPIPQNDILNNPSLTQNPGY